MQEMLPRKGIATEVAAHWGAVDAIGCKRCFPERGLRPEKLLSTDVLEDRNLRVFGFQRPQRLEKGIIWAFPEDLEKAFADWLPGTLPTP